MLQTALYILSYFEDKLLILKYEYIFKFLNELSNGDSFKYELMIKYYKQASKKFKISTELMTWFEEQSQKIDIMSKKRVNSVEKSKNNIKYYIEVEGKHIAVYFST